MTARVAETVYKLDEAAKIKSVSRDHLLRAIKASKGNTLAAKMVGRTYRIKASDLDAWYDALGDA